MAISIYDIFVPPFTQMLESLDKVLSKAEADVAARKIDPSVFISGRLAPDMLPLKVQIQIMTDQAKGGASRLAGMDPPKWADDEATFADLHAVVPQDCVRRRVVEIEVRRHELQQVVLAREVERGVRKLELDRTRLGALELRRLE